MIINNAQPYQLPNNSPRPYLPVKMTDSPNGADTVDRRSICEHTFAYMLVSSSNLWFWWRMSKLYWHQLSHLLYLYTDTTWIFTKRASGAAGRYRRAGYQAGATSMRCRITKQRIVFYLSKGEVCPDKEHSCSFCDKAACRQIEYTETGRYDWVLLWPQKCFTSPMDKNVSGWTKGILRPDDSKTT